MATKHQMLEQVERVLWMADLMSIHEIEVDIDFFVEEWTKHVGGGLPRQRLAAGSKR